MSKRATVVGSLDLLRQRRLAPARTPRPRLLLASAGLGLLPPLLVGLLAGWVALRDRQVRQELEALAAIPARVQALEGRAQALRRELRSVERSNETLARGVVAVESGSALLAQLMAITPQGVQITEARVQGRSLSLKGLAADPQAFRRVNALSLLLGQSPLVASGEVQIVKLLREAAPQASSKAPPPAPLVAWDLTAGLAQLPAQRQRRLLQQLGAVGLARRLQILEREGLLP